MNTEGKSSLDSSWKVVIRLGGLSLFAAGAVPVVFVLCLLIMQQTIPVPAEQALEDPVGPTLLYIVNAIGEFLLLPGGLALYLALKEVKRTPMVFATVMWSLSVSLFLAARGQIISLALISGRYLGTTDETMRAAYLASAELAIEIQSVYSYMALILLSVASIVFGLVMLKGVWGKRIGYVVIAAGILTLFTPLVIVGIPIIIPLLSIVLGAFWQLVVGLKLYRLGKDA